MELERGVGEGRGLVPVLEEGVWVGELAVAAAAAASVPVLPPVGTIFDGEEGLFRTPPPPPPPPPPPLPLFGCGCGLGGRSFGFC